MAHQIGISLSIFSWLTMAIIVAILGFMMNSGSWTAENQSFWTAVFNPLYIPQLAFRTTFAMTTAGLFVWFCIFFLTEKGSLLRKRAIRLSAGWSLVWLPFCCAASVWYWRVVPESMKSNVNVGLLTQSFSQWHAMFLKIITVSVVFLLLTALVGYFRPHILPRYALLLPMFLTAWWLGHFERVREFIRKPYVISGYMYSNGVRVAELPVFQRDGILPYATYSKIKQVTSTNQLEAGKEIFRLTCSGCHTVSGVNGVTDKLRTMKGDGPWDTEELKNFIHGMHLTRTYMPPFPGSGDEAGALAVYLGTLSPGQTNSPLLHTAFIPGKK